MVTRSNDLFQRALGLIPGGVNSPVRACKAVGCDPLFIRSGEGCRITDEDGKEYIDYVCSWGPLILGHRPPEVIDSICNVIERGLGFGAPVDLEVELARRVVDAVDSVEMVRMVNSGTEATMSAVRVARGYTRRDIVVKFEGCYHGHGDTFLVAAGSGVATLSIPGSPGVPEAVASRTVALPYNDKETFAGFMQSHGKETAAVIVEPVAGNMGLVAPAEGFLELLRETCDRTGALLIFDEVMTGFRLAYGGAQSIYGVRPDLTCFGKIIGGGLPVGAYGGRADIMSMVAPQGPVYQAGTLSGNPVAMAAGIATLDVLKQPGFYERLEQRSASLEEGFKKAARDAGIPVHVNRMGSMMSLFFTPDPVFDFESAKKSDTGVFSIYYKKMRDLGIYLPPSQFEALFVSAAHGDEEIDQTIRAAAAVMKALG